MFSNITIMYVDILRPNLPKSSINLRHIKHIRWCCCFGGRCRIHQPSEYISYQALSIFALTNLTNTFEHFSLPRCRFNFNDGSFENSNNFVDYLLFVCVQPLSKEQIEFNVEDWRRWTSFENKVFFCIYQWSI